MIKRLAIAPVLLIVVACNTTATKPNTESEAVRYDFRINEFSQGKMKKVKDEWTVYERTEDIRFQPNDTCMNNGQQTKCMRHGFVIWYDSKIGDVKLKCSTKTNNQVNEFELLLNGTERKFVNVQTLDNEPANADLVSETTCSHKGQQVLQFQQKVKAGKPGAPKK